MLAIAARHVGHSRRAVPLLRWKHRDAAAIRSIAPLVPRRSRHAISSDSRQRARKPFCSFSAVGDNRVRSGTHSRSTHSDAQSAPESRHDAQIPTSLSSAASASAPLPTPSTDSLSRRERARNLLQRCQHMLETCAALQGQTSTGSTSDIDEDSSSISRWLLRVRNAESSLEDQGSAVRRRKVVIVGNSASGTADLLSSLLEEPLEQVGSSTASGKNDAQEHADSTSSTLDQHRAISPASASVARVDSSASGALASRWLKDANVDLLEIIDPVVDADLIDTLYSADAIIFVTDVYMLALGPSSNLPSRVEDTDAVLRLLGHFASKPGTRLLVNHLAGKDDPSLNGVPGSAISSALERTIGASTLRRLAAQCLDTGAGPTDLDHPKASEAGLSQVASTGFIPISTRLAVQANAALRQALSASHAQSVDNPWDTFAQMYNTSKIGTVKELVRRPLVSSVIRGVQDEDSTVKTSALRLQSALFVAQHAFEEAQAVIADAQEELSLAQGAAEVLEDQAQRGCEAEMERILGESKTVMEHHGEASIDDSDAARIIAGPAVRQRAGDRSADGQGILTDSQRRLEYVLSRRLPWWKLPWKVDDVRAEVEAAIQNSFAKDAELKLVFEAGRMLSLAQDQYDQAQKTLADLRAWRGRDSASEDANSQKASRRPHSYFDSALFRNELQQSAPQETARFLTLDSLSRPISQRRQQLLDAGGPVDLLMVRAQKSTLQASLLGISSVLFSTYGTYLAPTFNLPYLSAVAMQPSTGFALTALVWSFAAFRLQGSWGKWKRRFWREWDSLTHLLDADLERNLEDVLRRRIFVFPAAAARGLKQMTHARHQDIAEAQRELEATLNEARHSKLYAARTKQL